MTLLGAASSMIAMSNVSIEDIKALSRLASEKKFAEVWEKEEKASGKVFVKG